MITDPKDLRAINHRDLFPEFLNARGYTGEGVELGTFKGEYARIVLSKWRGLRLNLIDPYKNFSKDEYLDGTAINHSTGTPLDFEEVFRQAHGLLNPFPASYFIRRTSAEASGMFNRESLDFVYVDANHSYDHVYRDILNWWPKLKVGGIMGFHDFYTRDDEYLKCGVFDAVMDYLQGSNQRPHVTCCTTAWILKT